MTTSFRLLLAVILLGAVAFETFADDRIPWATPRVTGSPDAPPAFQLQRVYPKLKFASPLDIAFPPGSDRVFVAEQSGKVWSFPRRDEADKPDLVVDLKQAVTDWKTVPRATGLDSLYGMAFHPRYQENHFVYLCYALAFPKRTQDPHGTRVSRFTVTGEPPRVQPGSEQILLEWQAGGHNRGRPPLRNGRLREHTVGG